MLRITAVLGWTLVVSTACGGGTPAGGAAEPTPPAAEPMAATAAPIEATPESPEEPAAAARSAPAAVGGTNLQILPATLTRPQIIEIMEKGIAPALGVKCDFCHVGEDYAKDTEKKNVARGMMKMVQGINKDNFAGEYKVTCVTCHNGAAKPKAP